MPREVNAENTTVRPRRTTDLDECAQALIQVYQTDGYPVEGVDDAVGWLIPPDLLKAWVAETSGKITGHVSISEPQASDDSVTLWLRESRCTTGQIAVLGRLFVISQARGLALGERLVITATTYAASIGRRLILDVMEKDRTAITLYERLGWNYIGPAAHTFGHGKITPARCYVSPQVVALNYDDGT